MQLMCPRCQTTNERDALFCKICGTGFNVRPIRRNSISTPVIVVIVVVAVCGFCGLFGLVNSNKTEVAKSTNSLTAVAFPTSSSSENSLPVGSLVETNNSANTGKPKNSKSAIVISKNANLRETANSSGEVIGTVPKDTEIEITRRKGAWFYVSAGGQTGWLHGNAIRLAENPINKPTTKTVNTSSPSISSPENKPQNSGDGSDLTGSSTRYTTGPRGGCYYIHGNGNKTYVDRSLCGGTNTSYKSLSSSSSSGGYVRGSRGGCYYYTASGRKQYVDRSLCD